MLWVLQTVGMRPTVQPIMLKSGSPRTLPDTSAAEPCMLHLDSRRTVLYYT